MKVSVCIATYNGEKYIKEQIDSILCQLSSEDEIVISDDGSSDNTLDIIYKYNDSRIKVYHLVSEIVPDSVQNRFKRATLNFENALKHAKGDYFFLSDQDDVWCPNKIKLCLPYLKEYDLLVHSSYIIDEFGNQLDQDLNLPFRTGLINLKKNSYIGCLMVFNKKMKELSIPFPKGLLAHDIWIGFISQFSGKVYFLKEKLIYNRRHGNNVSFNAEKSDNRLFFKIFYRMHFLRLFLMFLIFRRLKF